MAERNSSLTLRRILVPVDFSAISISALEFAGFIARQCNAKITLLHVLESYIHNTELQHAIDIDDAIRKAIEEKMEELKSSNKQLQGVTIEAMIGEGKIHSTIDNMAKKSKADLIVMGTHGASGITNIGKFFLGSNAYRTTQHSPVPVITMRSKPRVFNFKDILLPVDNTKDSMKKVDLAIQWASTFGSTVHILAVTAFFEELVTEFRDIRKKVLAIEKRLEKAGINYTSKIHRHQQPSISVMDYARKLNVDLIFIITGQESQVNELLLGSTARTIVSESKIPVMSLNVRD
jgi:nucleotide-binding universal stress UspA family protein